MLRLLLLITLVAVGPTLRAEEATAPAAGGLVGKVSGKYYVSPTGVFKVAVPVLPELGGEITDTPNVVTFQDAFNLHISIAAFPQDALQRWENSTRGTKDYLILFFRDVVLADFKQSFEGVQIESAKFLPGLLDGTLLTYILVPGGTMFANRVPAVAADGRPPVAKRGNFLFVKNTHIFVVSIELAERVIEGKAYQKTTAEEDEILRTRLNDIVSKIEFAAPTPAPAPAPAASAPTPAAPKK